MPLQGLFQCLKTDVCGVDIFMFAMCQHLYVYNNSCFHMFLDIIRVFKSVSGWYVWSMMRVKKVLYMTKYVDISCDMFVTLFCIWQDLKTGMWVCLVDIFMYITGCLWHYFVMCRYFYIHNKIVFHVFSVIIMVF